MNNPRSYIFHGLPLVMLVFPFLWFAVAGNDRMLKGEAGIIENLTVLFLVIAIGFCVSSLSTASRLGLSGFNRAWLVVLILGAAYFALEEISYGQHLFGWGTGETWKELNDQDETNLHNTHALFDQVPRTLLTLGILVGGVILPLYRLVRRIKLAETDRFYWQWPTLDCMTVGLLVILIRPIFSVIETDIVNTGETKENFIAMFIMFYCISIQYRLRLKAAAVQASEIASNG